jgi:hypothetical protein
MQNNIIIINYFQSTNRRILKKGSLVCIAAAFITGFTAVFYLSCIRR